MPALSISWPPSTATDDETVRLFAEAVVPAVKVAGQMTGNE